MIDSITLDNILPRAFAGMENDEPVKTSQVWLKRISFSRPGFYMVEAESGAGKSSMCSFIYGSRGDYSGDIFFDGRSVRQIGTDEWCRLRQRAIAYLPQELMLFPELTVMDNIEIKNRLTRINPSAGFSRPSRLWESRRKPQCLPDNSRWASNSVWR